MSNPGPLSPSSLLALSLTDAFTPLPPPLLASALSNPPFLPVPGTFNTRDLGLLPASRLKPHLFYRSGSLAGLTDEGKRVLRDELGVRTVYDLRSVAEHEAQPDPEVDGVRVVWEGSAEGSAMVELGGFVEGGGEEGVEGMYLGVLGMYKAGLKGLLRGVMEGEGGVLVHCTGELTFAFLCCFGGADRCGSGPGQDGGSVGAAAGVGRDGSRSD